MENGPEQHNINQEAKEIPESSQQTSEWAATRMKSKIADFEGLKSENMWILDRIFSLATTSDVNKWEDYETMVRVTGVHSYKDLITEVDMRLGLIERNYYELCYYTVERVDELNKLHRELEEKSNSLSRELRDLEHENPNSETLSAVLKKIYDFHSSLKAPEVPPNFRPVRPFE